MASTGWCQPDGINRLVSSWWHQPAGVNLSDQPGNTKRHSMNNATGGSPSPVLLAVPQRILDAVVCRRLFGKYFKPSMLCAGGVKGEDSCQGDSGGPLFVRTPTGGHEVVGIVSFGDNCATGAPAVYTKVASFLPWVEDNIADGMMCTPPG
ncbi:phenoloxidase-activating factor 3-like [Hyalella azteca]|uniref:Phenoloxidase-activating factor 3-like n=1 Tax=Hyalella azteca TaxID=294128 RepID=A0A8B7NC45_HYAAZ|nr:phenoloxidase-activating factor 3-like [Hyalella azteca]